jgi:peptidoglycan biosynthesis protein MviN/MurJ (putative lipid II flippase)
MVSPDMAPKPRWYAVPARALFVTMLLTLLSFAVTLLVTILTMVIAAAIRGTNPDMRFAYRHVALPVAVVVGGLVLVVALAMEIRHYRQAKTLNGIARLSR